MTTESFTYKELAERLGIKLASARKTVQRKRWQRVTGNDGTVRIIVPIDALPSPAGRSDSPSDSPYYTHELEAEIKRLTELLEMTRQDRDRWHALAVQPWWRRLVG